MESHTVLWILLSLITTVVGSNQNLLIEELRRDKWIAASVVTVLPASLEGPEGYLYGAIYKAVFHVTLGHSEEDLRKASVNVYRTCLQHGVEPAKPELISVDVYEFIQDQREATMKVDFMPYDVFNYDKEHCYAFTFRFVCTADNPGTSKIKVVYDTQVTIDAAKKRKTVHGLI